MKEQFKQPVFMKEGETFSKNMKKKSEKLHPRTT